MRIRLMRQLWRLSCRVFGHRRRHIMGPFPAGNRGTWDYLQCQRCGHVQPIFTPGGREYVTGLGDAPTRQGARL